MAGKLMVSPQAVSKWETGQALPDAEQLLSLSQLFGIPINTILTGETAGSTSDAAAPPKLAVAPERNAAERAATGPDQQAIIRLAPFVDEDVLRDMIQNCGLETFTLQQMVALAPFITTDLLNRYTEGVMEIDAHHLNGLAPFVSPEQLGHLVDRLTEPLTAPQVIAMAPFLPTDMLQAAVEANPPRSFEELNRVAPFLETEFVTRMARQLMAG